MLQIRATSTEKQQYLKTHIYTSALAPTVLEANSLVNEPNFVQAHVDQLSNAKASADLVCIRGWQLKAAMNGLMLLLIQDYIHHSKQDSPVPYFALAFHLFSISSLNLINERVSSPSGP